MNLLLGFQWDEQDKAAKSKAKPGAAQLEQEGGMRRADSSEVKGVDTKGIPSQSSLNKEPRLKPGAGPQKESASGTFL